MKKNLNNELKGNELIKLTNLYKEFSDPTRVRIMMLLLNLEACVQDIANILNMTQSAVSHQLKLLKSEDLVKSRREGKNIYYSLADEHVKSIISMGLEHIRE
jgi:ArsR family transcriptional regulator